jgi:hypothetical protein
MNKINFKTLTFLESEIIIDDLKKYYAFEIMKAARKMGNLERLSLMLNFSSLYLYKLLKRNSLTALRKIVKKIYEKKLHKCEYF